MKQQYLENYPCIELKNGEVIFLEKEKLTLLNDVIETLPPKRLEVFKMRYYDGLDNNSIAKQLGISANTVKVHLVKARLYLKEMILLDGPISFMHINSGNLCHLYQMGLK